MTSEKQKKILLEHLHKIPIVQIVCDKAGVSRATFYRWKQDDKMFAKSVEEAMGEGKLFINDLSESQVISLVRDKNWQAIAFWLKHHHKEYGDKVELTNRVTYEDETLTLEQEAIVKKTLQFASSAPEPDKEHGKPNIKPENPESGNNGTNNSG